MKNSKFFKAYRRQLTQRYINNFPPCTRRIIFEKIAEGKLYLQYDELGQGIVPALDDYFVLTSLNGFKENELFYIKPFYTGLKDRYVSCPLEKYLIYTWLFELLIEKNISTDD